jgi:hypothetical protein
MARVRRIDELEQIEVAGVRWRPVRRSLGITGFGINGYSADAGQRLIEEHDETGDGAAGHEELYVTLQGHARFNVDGVEIDAPAGTLVFVPEPDARRSAVAIADTTTVMVVGGHAGTITPSAWEYYFAAAPAVRAGDPRRAYQIAAAGLGEHSDNASMHFNLACFAALAGDPGGACEHLAKAFALNPQTREWAASDSDLDSIRSDPRYPG